LLKEGWGEESPPLGHTNWEGDVEERVKGKDIFKIGKRKVFKGGRRWCSNRVVKLRGG
jgi:hypothetical protein